jgi:hypothetical protein
MKTENIGRQFAAMGARFKVAELPVNRRHDSDYAIDIQQDRRGEFFELRVPKELTDSIDLAVLQSDKQDRHLLMLVRNARDEKQRDRYLCGHDERAWFVAAVPKRVSTVSDAKEALKPRIVLHAQSRRGLSAKERHRRRNSVFVRQGEWFFVPEPRLVVRKNEILPNEPIRRGNGKAHIVQEVVRIGGQTVYVSSTHPNGITVAQHRKLIHNQPEKARLDWRVMRADAWVFARGTVRHPDHKTINLPFWHRVLMNTEHESPGMPRVAFLD